MSLTTAQLEEQLADQREAAKRQRTEGTEREYLGSVQKDVVSVPSVISVVEK